MICAGEEPEPEPNRSPPGQGSHQDREDDALQVDTQKAKHLQTEAQHPTPARDVDELVLIEHCAGIGGGRWALELLGLRPGALSCGEISEPAARALKATYPSARLLGDPKDLTYDVQRPQLPKRSQGRVCGRTCNLCCADGTCV